MAQMVKNLSTVQETWIRNLGGEDPLEKGTATRSSILVWRIPWTEKPVAVHGGRKESDMIELLSLCNGNSLYM